MRIWLIILGMAAVTYGTRLLPLVSFDAERLPFWARRALNYVPIAVLSAIIAPAYLPQTDWGAFDLGAALPSGLVAVAVAWFTRNTYATIGAGMAALILLSELGL